MLLLPPLLHDLDRDGGAPEVIAGLDLGDISQKAAERFDRGRERHSHCPALVRPPGTGGGPG
ncbi:MAG: hypothetical protein WCC12_16810 [Anaerolineales bacterium]